MYVEKKGKNLRSLKGKFFFSFSTSVVCVCLCEKFPLRVTMARTRHSIKKNFTNNAENFKQRVRARQTYKYNACVCVCVEKYMCVDVWSDEKQQREIFVRKIFCLFLISIICISSLVIRTLNKHIFQRSKQEGLVKYTHNFFSHTLYRSHLLSRACFWSNIQIHPTLTFLPCAPVSIYYDYILRNHHHHPLKPHELCRSLTLFFFPSRIVGKFFIICKEREKREKI